MNQPFVDAVDALLSAPKEVAGLLKDSDWQFGATESVRRLVVPLQSDGETVDAYIEILAYPNNHCLKFTLKAYALGHEVWRVCHDEDEGHTNSRKVEADQLPRRVEGHHHHSWAKNKRFFKKIGSAVVLKNAEKLPVNLTDFYETYGWFCSQININNPPEIELPPRDRLL